MCYSTHIVLYDLFDPGHSEDKDERDQSGVATSWRYIRDLLMRHKLEHSDIPADTVLSGLKHR